MKKVQPQPFRRAIDTVAHNDDELKNAQEPFEYLTTSYNLLTLRTSNKYFVPQTTYLNET